jgi:two-component system nitrate/nitrite response regulator NarL
MRCLVIDDNTEDRSLVERLLRQCGYRSTCVPGGEAALTVLAGEPFDIALVDLGMPGMNGVETLRALKLADDRMRLLVVSSFDDRTHVLQAIEAGADGYLRKDELVDYLRLALQAVRAGQHPLSPGISSVLVRYMTGRAVPSDRDRAPARKKLADASGELVIGSIHLPPRTDREPTRD